MSLEIAAIIWPLTDEERNHFSRSEGGYRRYAYTVDDLLTWIYAQTESYPDMIPVWDMTEGDGTKRGDGWLVEDERWDEWAYGYTPVYSVFGPTLLAALEAAVLDIARRPTPSEDA